VLVLSLVCKEIMKEPSLSASPVITQGFNLGLRIKVEYVFFIFLIRKDIDLIVSFETH